MSRVRGKFSCLLINDIDAGIGHFKDTQVTVNNQVCCIEGRTSEFHCPAAHDPCPALTQ